jgi:cell division protein FtsB
MITKHTIIIGVSILILIGMLVYSIFCEYGYSHLSSVRQKQMGIIQMNEQIVRENHQFRVEIDRLKYDPVYIESIARHELGMVKKHEIILKPRN